MNRTTAHDTIIAQLISSNTTITSKWT